MALRAAIYARYSSHNQREESIEDQVRVCTQKAEDDGCEVVAVFADKAISGRTDRRPDFLRMIDQSERGLFDRVYTYKTDRFARNRLDAAVYKARLRKNGVTLVCAAETIPDGPDGIILESVLEGMAEWYSANLSQNVRRGLDGNAAKCKANGVVKLGYNINSEGYYEINEPEAEMLRKAAREWIDGKTLAEICDTTCRAHRSVRGGKITPNALSKAFRDEKYRGVYSYGSYRVEGGMPRIFDEDLTRRIDARIGSDGRGRRGGNSVYMLSGILTDSKGRAFWGNSGRNHDGIRYDYYRCYETGESYPREVIEDAVARAVADMVSEDGVADRIADLVVEAHRAACASDVSEADAIRMRIKDAEREKSSLIDLAAKVGADDEIADRMVSLRDEISELKADLEEIELGTPEVDRDRVLYFLERIMAEKDPRRLIPGFVSRVVVLPGKLRVEFSLSELGVCRGSELVSVAEE